MAATPKRMCIACRTMRPKQELVRLIAGKDGIEVDPTYKTQQRGCYVCPDPACVAKARKIKALERTFHRGVDAQVYERLTEYVAKR